MTSELPSYMTVRLTAPALAPADHRPARVVRALNEIWPGGDLVYEVGARKGRSTMTSREPDLEEWLASAAGRGKFPLMSTTGDEPLMVSGHNWIVDFKSGELPVLSVMCQYPMRPETLAFTNELLAKVGVALEAHWGEAASYVTGSRIGTQVKPPGSNREGPPGLPPLLVTDDLAGPDVPQVLGWINYWSAPAVARLDFPASDPGRDEEWLSRAHRLPGGAWVVQLTDESLDLDRPDHLERLRLAYERFAAVGRAAG